MSVDGGRVTRTQASRPVLTAGRLSAGSRDVEFADHGPGAGRVVR